MSEEFVRSLNDPRNVLRRKVMAILDLFDASHFERGIAMDRFEKGIRTASEERLGEALRILRE